MVARADNVVVLSILVHGLSMEKVARKVMAAR